MTLTPQEKTMIELLRNISHENVERINNVLYALMVQGLMEYSEGKPMVIPYFGTFLIRFKGDKITSDGKKEAVLESFFDPAPYFKENIGAYEDFKKGISKDMSNIPCIKQLEISNAQCLKMALNESGNT